MPLSRFLRTFVSEANMGDFILVTACSIMGLACLLMGLGTSSIGDGLGWFFVALLSWVCATGLIVTREV